MRSIGDNPTINEDISLGRQREYSIDIDFEGRRGTFVFRRPSLADRMEMGVLESTYLGEKPRNSFDMATLNLARIFSTFQKCLVRAPKWFNITTEDDYEFMERLYTRYFEEVQPFRNAPLAAIGDKEISTDGDGSS